MITVDRALTLKVAVTVPIILKRKACDGRKGPARTFQTVARVRACRVGEWSASLDINGVDKAILLNRYGQAAATHLSNNRRRREIRIKIVLNSYRLYLPEYISIVPIKF